MFQRLACPPWSCSALHILCFLVHAPNLWFTQCSWWWNDYSIKVGSNQCKYLGPPQATGRSALPRRAQLPRNSPPTVINNPAGKYQKVLHTCVHTSALAQCKGRKRDVQRGGYNPLYILSQQEQKEICHHLLHLNLWRVISHNRLPWLLTEHTLESGLAFVQQKHVFLHWKG